MLSPLSRLLDAIQRSPTLWHRLGAASRQADLYAALVAVELEEAPEDRRAGLFEARMVAPIGPWERMLTYAQWVDARAAEVASEGVVGGGQGQGWWPSAKRGETVEEIGQDAAIAGGRGTDAQATENAAPRPRVEEELVAGPEAEARIKELRTRHGRAVRVRWGRRWTAEEGRGVVSYPDEEGLTT